MWLAFPNQAPQIILQNNQVTFVMSNVGAQGIPGAPGSGVSSISIVSANGFAGTVTNPTTTPAITLTTSITGILKGDGTSISAATAGTDYQAPITLTTTGTSGAATFIGGTLNIPQYSGSGSSGFNSITSGTNTNAAMVVGSGGSLAASGSGTIAATSAPAGTLTGTTLASGVTASSLTSFGSGIALGTPASGTLTNCTFPTLNQNTTGSAGSVAAANITGSTLAAGVTGSSLASVGTLASLVVTGSVTAGSFLIGALGYSDTGILAALQSSTNSYNQIIVINTNSGAAASSDIVVNNNLSTATTYYGDLGMNGSGFTGSGSLNLANAVYLSATTGDLVLGTTTANAIHFVINGGTTDALTIGTGGAITVGVWQGSIIGSSYGGAGSINGIMKANGSGTVSAAAAGTDYQAPITLTTTGTSGAATFISNTLNIPQYSGGGSSAFNGITSGTNTSAAMVVGSGSSLVPSGTGNIEASMYLPGSALAAAINSAYYTAIML